LAVYLFTAHSFSENKGLFVLFQYEEEEAVYGEKTPLVIFNWRRVAGRKRSLEWN
jgi:hypothetical protein